MSKTFNDHLGNLQHMLASDSENCTDSVIIKDNLGRLYHYPHPNMRKRLTKGLRNLHTSHGRSGANPEPKR